ncbi:ribonuclease H-like domain-containing protein [Tanacetum coccineum]
MQKCNPVPGPCDTESKLGSDGDPVSDPTLYRSLAGALQYLTFTRPDLSYAVQQLHLSSTTQLTCVLLMQIWLGALILRRIVNIASIVCFSCDNLLTWSAKLRLPSLVLVLKLKSRLQKIVSRLVILGVVISQEDLNSKFLSSLPPEWNTHVVVWMNKPEIETMIIDDLYNNFKIVEQKVKKYDVQGRVFNVIKDGHLFARECRAPRNKEGQFRNQDNTRKQGNNEDTYSNRQCWLRWSSFDLSENMARRTSSDKQL